ncbi:MAG: hypothetical protein GDA43_09390 [Hormoscilla sp. SP5CHS1]|nr:hypothetical protein [Hormoscilla sp. SP12CHS1]MBC6453397.1 hypothetical protein [Hormoscilla sp. SP5CHS1]
MFHNTGNINIDFLPISTSCSLFSGLDSFRYSISDGNDRTDSATVIVSVEGANQAPIAVDDSVATREWIPVLIDLLANDSDPDGDLLNVFVSTSENGGTIARDDNGAVTRQRNSE